MIIAQLFMEFFLIGLFAIGGGMATLPFLSSLGQRTGWFTQGQLIDMIAISESTPGPIGINMATYVGYTTAGVPGAVASTLAEIVPSILIIALIARFLQRYAASPLVQDVFYALRPASLGLIAAAAFSVMGLAVLRLDAFRASGNVLQLLDYRRLLLAGGLAWALWRFKPHPALLIAASAIAGMVFSMAA